MEKKELCDRLAKSENFCAYPFVQLSTVPAGFMRPCCFFGRMLHREGTHHYNIAENTIEETWNSADMRDIRKKMLANEKNEACLQCHHEEKSGAPSMRLRSIEHWLHRPDVQEIIAKSLENNFSVGRSPFFLELKPGNLCNLKCRMCNQFDSSQIASELKDLAGKLNLNLAKEHARLFDDGTFELDFSVDKMPNWSEQKGLWDSVKKMVPQLEMLSFAGGEPTLIPEVYQLLKFCVELGYAKHITVFFASNFTRITDDLIEISKSFKEFYFMASIDGYGPIQEYIRFPSKWSNVSRNFERVKNHMGTSQMNVAVNYTLQMYNILTFTDSLRWLDELDALDPAFNQAPYNVNLLYYPRYLSIENLPSEGRRIAVDSLETFLGRSPILKRFPFMRSRLEMVINLLRQPPPEDEYVKNLAAFWQFTQILDEHRKQKLSEADPVLFEIVSREIVRLKLNNLESSPQYRTSRI